MLVASADPLMMFPVYQVVESLRCLEGKPLWLKNLSRLAMVSLTILASLVVPNFGIFISLCVSWPCLRWRGPCSRAHSFQSRCAC